MGYRIAWVGFEGLDRASCLTLTAMHDTTRLDEANEAPFSLASLPTGWTSLFSNASITRPRENWLRIQNHAESLAAG